MLKESSASLIQWLFRLLAGCCSVKFRVHNIEVIAVQVILNNAQSFTEALEMNNFAGS